MVVKKLSLGKGGGIASDMGEEGERRGQSSRSERIGTVQLCMILTVVLYFGYICKETCSNYDVMTEQQIEKFNKCLTEYDKINCNSSQRSESCTALVSCIKEDDDISIKQVAEIAIEEAI